MRGSAWGAVAVAAVIIGGISMWSPASGESPEWGHATYEYTVRCVFKGSESGVLANYKLRCTELGSEVTLCSSLEFEACQIEVVNEMGKEGWRYLGKGTDALGPNASLTFERVTPVQPPPAPPPEPADEP